MGHVCIAPDCQECLDALVWQEDIAGSSTYSRLCHGQEASASFNQNSCDGHTELSMCLTFSYGGSNEDLVGRAQRAWQQIRRHRPECGVELSTGNEVEQTMRFTDFATRGARGLSEERDWLKDTWQVVHAGVDPSFKNWLEVAQMTYRRKLDTVGKRSKMYLVLAPPRPSPSGPSRLPNEVSDDLDDFEADAHCFIWNVSHAVTDGFSFNVFFNDFLELVARDEAGPTGVDSSFLRKRLPGSVLSSYVRQYRPTEQTWLQSQRMAQDQITLCEQRIHESITLRPNDDQLSRSHLTTCLLSRLTADATQSVMLKLKTSGRPISITYIGAASMILGIRRLFAAGHETGALLGLTRNARRWVRTDGFSSLEADGADHENAIPMATDVVYLWVPFNGLSLPPSNEKPLPEHIISLAHRIKDALLPHLASPHYIAQLHLTAISFMDRLLASQTSSSNEHIAGPQAPGFSPGGAWSIREFFPSSGDKRQILKRHFLYQTGRQVNASPWMSMYSVGGRLCFHLGFDEKYWQPHIMESLIRLTKEGVATLVHLDTLSEADQSLSTMDSTNKAGSETVDAVKKTFGKVVAEAQRCLS